MSKTLLIVHHTPSPHCQEMFEAALSGATDPDIEGVEVVRRPALTVSPVEMLEADGYLLGSPANLGYISGALKHYLVDYPTIRQLHQIALSSMDEAAVLTRVGRMMAEARQR
jgi:multimeric flavodoxin WrbA